VGKRARRVSPLGVKSELVDPRRKEDVPEVPRRGGKFDRDERALRTELRQPHDVASIFFSVKAFSIVSFVPC
jgi:hypothetical protein